MALVRIKEDKTQARRYPRNERGGRGSYAMRRYHSNSKVYVFEDGESIIENLMERRQRPSARYKAIVLEQHPELEGKIRWSQKAGCSCGCSPGFLVDHTVRKDGSPADIFITITTKPPEPIVDMSYVEMALAA